MGKWLRVCPVPEFKKSISTRASLISLHLWAEGELSLLLAGSGVLFLVMELKTAVRVGEQISWQSSLVYLHDRVTDHKKNLPAFLSFPSCHSSSPPLRKIHSVITIWVNRILFKAT